MGGITSSISNYVDVWKMDTFAEIDYQDDMRRQFETMRAFGRQEALTQSVRAGGFSGPGGVGYPFSPNFGNAANFWYGINTKLVNAALPSIALALVLAGVGYAFSSRFIFFAAVWLFVFSLVNFVTLNQTQAARYAYRSRYFFQSFGLAVITSIIVLVVTPF